MMRGTVISALLLAAPVPAIAAPVAAADAAAINMLVQRTWSRFGTTGVPRGPRFDPPRTPAFAKATAAFLGPDPEGLSEPPDNLYCMCFNEYKPRLQRVSLSGVSADVIEAHTAVTDTMGSADVVIWRMVRGPQGWLLDDIWSQGGPISVQRRPIRQGRRL